MELICVQRKHGITSRVDVITLGVQSVILNYHRMAAVKQYCQKNRQHTAQLLKLCVAHDVLMLGKVVRMTMLRNMFQKYMHCMREDFFNPEYCTLRLKLKLQEHFGDQLQFWLPQAHCKSELVYSADLDLGEAVESAFDACASESKILSKAAAILRRDIKQDQSSAEEMPWPPSAEFLTSKTVSPPKSLMEFVSEVITGKSSSQSTEKSSRLTSSIAQDICSASTGGMWTMPKHIMLGMTLRHLTGRADILTFLNRYGHCLSYTKIMELDTALAYDVQKGDSLLPSNISVTGNIVSHLCWDNFDINEETPSGAGTTHTTHGIVIQELEQAAAEVRQVAVQQRTRERSFKFVPESLQPCYTRRRVKPVICSTACSSLDEQGQPVSSGTVLDSVEHLRGLLWGMFNGQATMPDWNGWVQ